MARLDARWDNFKRRNQAWDHFWLDGQPSGPFIGSFLVDAVLLRPASGSFTADALILRPASASLAANAVIKREQTGSFTANAVIKSTRSGSFTADAVITSTPTNARVTQVAVEVLVQSTGTLARVTQVAAEALVQSSVTNARVTQVAVEVLYQAIPGGAFTADAVLKRTQTGSFTADAVITSTPPGAFTANAVVLSSRSGSLTADAILKTTAAGSFTADATVALTTAGLFTADAVIKKAQAGSFTLDASLFVAGIQTFPADAVIKRTQVGSFVADAVIQRTQTSSFTADAVVAQGGAGAFSADAVIKRTQSGSFTADAAVVRTATGSFSADAVIKKTQTGSFVADAVISDGSTGGSFTADAVISAGAAGGSFTANAFLAKLIEDDDFNRTVAEGFGLRYRNRSTTEDKGAVNGSEGVVSGANAQPWYETQSGYHRPRTGYLQFDFWVPADRTDESWYYAVDGAHPSGSFEPTELELYHSGTGNIWAADIYPSDLYYEFTPDASTWYTIKGYFEASDGGVAAIKVWKRSDPEPDVWTQYGEHGAYVANPAFWTSHFYVDAFDTTNQDAKADNLKAWAASTEPWEFQDYFRLDAVIYDPSVEVTGSFTANAVIKQTFGNGSSAAPVFGTGLTNGTGSGPANAASLPTGVSDGELMVAFISYDSEGDTARTWSRTGWALLANALVPNGDHGLAVLAKVKTASDSGTQTFNATGSGSTSRMAIARITGADPTKLAAVIGSATQTTGTTSHPTSSITSPTASALLLLGAGGSANNTWTPPSGMTEQYDATTGSWVSLEVSSQTLTTEAVGVKTATSNASVASGLVWLVVRGPGRGFTADAYIIWTRVEGSFTANAVIRRERTGSLTADAYIFDGFGSGSFTADAIIYFGSTGSESTGGGGGTSGSGGSGGGTVPGGGGGGSGGSLPQTTITILYDGVDITDDVDIAATEFVSMTNGNTGTARVRVLDTGHGHTFTTGKSLTLDINGRRYWGGYVMQASKAYPFPVLDTSTPGTVARYWDLVGYDYAFLFERRIVYSPAYPKKKTDWTFPAGTYDDTIINTMFDNYIPGLAGDGLSRSGVQRVDVAILDIPGVTSGVDASGHRNTGGTVASAGFTWRQMMDSVARATGAVYYISATKVLHYADVDTADTAYILTDQPSLPVDVGYQKMALNYSGTKLVNDYLLWGAALGHANMTFKHLISNSSVATHNRWQAGNFNGALYRQTSVDLAASTVINGTPQNKRGHKDDAVSFTCTVFVPVLHVGQKVRVISSIYDFDDVIPIRVMRITFANLHQAIFELTLSHSIDEAWSTVESFWPKLAKPPVPGGQPPPPPPPPPPPGCDDETCGITDTFTRTVSGGWGTSDFGTAWQLLGSSVPYASVDGSQAVQQVSSPGSYYGSNATLDFGQTTTDMTWSMYFNHDLASTSSPNDGTAHEYFWAITDSLYIEFGKHSSFGNYVMLQADDNPYDGIAYHGVSYTSPFNIRITQVGDEIQVRIWQSSSTEPASPTLAVTPSWTAAMTFFQTGIAQQDLPSAPEVLISHMDDLNIAGINRCGAVQFENFDRELSGEWGETSGQGGAWSTPTGTGTCGVTAGAAYVMSGARTAWVPGALWDLDPVTLTARFEVSVVGAASSVSFAISDDLSYYAQVYVSIDNFGGGITVTDNIDFNNDSILITNFTTGWWRVKWQLEGSIHRAKVWRESTTEPDWQVATALPNLAGRTYLIMTLVAGTGNTTAVDSIDFDYDGKPCYSDCSDVTVYVWDNFNRSTGTNQIGTSSSGYTYEEQFVGGGNHGVDGASFFTYASGTASYYNYNVVPFDNQQFILTMRVRFTAMPTTFATTLLFRVQNTSGTEQVELYLWWQTSDLSYVRLTLNGDIEAQVGLPTVGGGSGWLPLTWYNVEYDGTNGWLRIWPDGANKPAGLAVATTPAQTYNRVAVAWSNGGPGTSELGDVTVTYGACVDALPAEGGPQVPASGLARETLAYAGGTNYYTSQAYQAGSTEVFVNGLRSPRGSGGYSESGPTTGVISFYSPLTASDIVTISYQSQGPTNA